MSSPPLHVINRCNNRFYSYPNYITTKVDINENAYAINSLESLHSFADNKHNQNETKDKCPGNIEAIKTQQRPSSFYPLHEVANKPMNLTSPSKISRFSRFIHRFQLRISKTTSQNKKYNTVTGISIIPTTNDHSTLWKRRFSRHHTSMFNPREEKLLSLHLPTGNLTDSKLIDIFSPPVYEPMKTIDSLKDQLNINEEVSTNYPSKSFDFDFLYNDSFFTTAVRKPISYDNSQITDETIVI